MARADAPGAANLPALLARVDADWGERDEPGKLEAARAALDEAERLAPADFEVLWRLARLHFWVSDNPALPDAEKSRVGKLAWDLGDRAAAARPERVEGWYFAAGGVGNYALGLGILKALSQGIEGKFKDRLSKAEKVDPRFFWGGVYVAWGRFWFKLPWPKYDAKKSEAALQRALRVNPDNVRARFFLAELYEKEGDPKAARRFLEEAEAHAPGSYDGPEERRSLGLVRAKLGGAR